MWRSLVAHPLWERGAGGSNPSIPTKARIVRDFGLFCLPMAVVYLRLIELMDPITSVRKSIIDRAPVCGSTKIIAIDGRSGVGKTEFAGKLARELDCDTLSLEWVYPGWLGLTAGIDALATALQTLAHDVPAQVPQWNWHLDEPAQPVTILPTELLILEGVGAGAAALRPFVSYLLWLDAPADVRQIRAMSRDGGAYARWWNAWAEQEELYLAADRPMDHADLLLPTASASD